MAFLCLISAVFSGCGESDDAGSAGSTQKLLMEIPKGVAE